MRPISLLLLASLCGSLVAGQAIETAAQAQTTMNVGRYGTLRECPQGSDANPFEELPDGKTEIAALPGGNLCFESSARATREKKLDDAKHATWLAKCESSKSAHNTLPYFQSGCLLIVDGCGEVVSSDCLPARDYYPESGY